NVRYREAFPTDTSLDAGQDRENIAKTFAMPHEALPRVTSLGGGEGNKRREGLAQEDAPNTGGGGSKKDKGKGKMTEPKQPSKEEVLKQMSIQLARDLEAKFAQEDLIIREQAKRDAEIARIHAEKELEIMIAELDRSNEMIAKTVELFGSMLAPQGKGSNHPSEPHHTPSAQDESLHHAHVTSLEPIPQSHKQTTSLESTIPSQSHSV
nr:hypothetical protein [Tanacetum cinerariifolium]